MKWNIKDCGESIEKLAATQLEQGLVVKYNIFWGKYIGHKDGQPLLIKGISEEQNRKRLLLGQWCYSVLQNQLFLKKLSDVPTNIKRSKEKLAKSIRVFLESTHILFNTIEIVNHFNEDFTEYTINIDSLSSFKKFRNILTHNIRPLIGINSMLMVPKNLEVFYDWTPNERKIWILDSYEGIEYWSLLDYVDFVYKKNSNLLFELLRNATHILTEELGESLIEPPDPILFTDECISASGDSSVNVSGITSASKF